MKRNPFPFTKNKVNAGKSLAADRRHEAKTIVPKAQGGRGDETWSKRCPRPVSFAVRLFSAARAEAVQFPYVATATTMGGLQFVANHDVDPLLFESSCYVAPEAKVGKPYALFMAAHTETKREVIAKVAMHNREHVVLIRRADAGWLLCGRPSIRRHSLP